MVGRAKRSPPDLHAVSKRAIQRRLTIGAMSHSRALWRAVAAVLPATALSIWSFSPSSLASAAGGHVAAQRTPIEEVGTGTSSPDPCLDRPGRCGFVVQGTLAGQPADETFFSVIQDDGAADDGGCVRAHYAGLLGDGPDQSIGHVADGRLCAGGAGGFVFTGRFTITGGLGRFEGARGRGDVTVTIGGDGSATLTATGSVRLPG